MPGSATRFRRPPDANNERFRALVRSIVSGSTAQVLEIIGASPDLVQKSATAGASREAASPYFFPSGLGFGFIAFNPEGGGTGALQIESQTIPRIQVIRGAPTVDGASTFPGLAASLTTHAITGACGSADFFDHIESPSFPFPLYSCTAG